MRLFSDDEGMIHVHVKPTGEHDESVRFVVECDGDGERKRFPLELRSSHRATAEMPAPSCPASTGAKNVRTRPPSSTWRAFAGCSTALQ